MEHRIAGIAARAEDDVRLEIADDAVRLFQCAADGERSPDVMPDGARLQAAHIAGDLQRFEPEALARDQSGLHAVLRADKQDLAVRTALEQHARNGKGWIDVSARSAAGEYGLHGPASFDYLGLWVMLRDTFSTMPFSASCMMSAVPP